MAPIYRAPMRSRARDVPAGAGAEHGVANGLVGIGEALIATPETHDAGAERRTAELWAAHRDTTGCNP